tara:strand:- start:24081 stop:24599 length:519 start_codon:yes stop_codon:yes gene_type:complete
MAITGTKVKSSGGGSDKYYINKCYITNAEQIESQYSDTTVKLELEDNSNGYKYTMFMNQNYVKDIHDVVTELKFPDLVNTLFLAANVDLDITDTGDINLKDLANKQIACLSYPSTGKYKRAIWSTVSSWTETDELGKDFETQLSKGYPKNYKKETGAVQPVPSIVAAEDLPF